MTTATRETTPRRTASKTSITLELSFDEAELLEDILKEGGEDRLAADTDRKTRREGRWLMGKSRQLRDELAKAGGGVNTASPCGWTVWNGDEWEWTPCAGCDRCRP